MPVSQSTVLRGGAFVPTLSQLHLLLFAPHYSPCLLLPGLVRAPRLTALTVPLACRGLRPTSWPALPVPFR